MAQGTTSGPLRDCGASRGPFLEYLGRVMLSDLVTQVTLGPIRFRSLRSGPNLALLALFILVSVLRALAVVLAFGGARSVSIGMPFFEQITGALGVWAATPIVLGLVLAMPKPKRGWLLFALAHLGGFLVFSVAQIVVMFALRGFFGGALGLYGMPIVLRFQIAWELQQNLIVYGGVAALLSLLLAWEEQQKAQIKAARLTAEVATARLDALTAKIDPHFLYNTLNTVSGVMFRQLELAERLLVDLAEILRATLESDQATWTLAEEQAHAERYVRILEARFGERLSVEWSPARTSSTALVPRFSLQSLIENAVKHNAQRVEPLRICVRMTTSPGSISVLVEDDGDGMVLTERPRGRGLDRLAEMLELLYPGGPGLQIEGAKGKGTRVAFTARET
jgi:two-component system, LytTR family, sensor kinase